MTCQELLDLLMDYHGGGLEVEKHRTVEVHLSQCKHCLTIVETYSYTVKLARALPKCDRLPSDVENRLRASLKPHLSREGNE